MKQIVQDLEQQTEIDYVNVSAGVHHAFIHTPMEFEAGWERGYARGIRDVSSKPVLLVGRITTPDVAEMLLERGCGRHLPRATALRRPRLGLEGGRGREEDIRRCVAANFCWKSVSRGGRVQCVYNPEIGREATWGKGTLTPVSTPKKVLVIGGGPAGLEFARVSAARGHDVVLLEREAELGGHVYLQSLLPSRSEFGTIADWLQKQAQKNGAEIRTSSPVTAENLQEVLTAEAPDHVVVATGSKYRADGFQGWTAESLPGHDSGQCVTWEDVVTGKVHPSGHVVVIDDDCGVIAPLCAVALAENGTEVKIVTLADGW
ncbi:MAG TPA: FAD-dependent oxidoreductase [Gaiellaceae bacterium]|nr:FAD-dependent oxidoreductase [Gaiellaceae bacterium]